MSDEKDLADEPAYEQLGDAGNPFTHPDTDAAGQPDLDTETEDELDRAERHD
jgi:hypothetical protein